MDTQALLLGAELEKQLALLSPEQPPAVQARALALLTVLLSRCEDDSVPAVAAALPTVLQLLGSEDRLVLGNACAALCAASSLHDELAASVAADASEPLAALLCKCAAAEEQAHDLQLNVVAALGQLARDQEPTARALASPAALSSLLLLADSQQPSKLQEAVADGLCALASKEWAREQLYAAGAVAAAARLLDAKQLDVSVRCLMVLGMLLPSSPAAQQELAADAAALQQLMELLKQQEDMDCKIIAKDLLGLLMKDEALRGQVEAAVRAAAANQQQPQEHEQQAAA